jgi:FixJ family two-component response regulator
LGRLPVIICSVLPQKNLAASLGAADFIQKPIQRDTFINAIEKASATT